MPPEDNQPPPDEEPPDPQDNPLPPAEDSPIKDPLPQTDEPPPAEEPSIEEPPAEKPIVEGPFPKEDQPLPAEEPPVEEPPQQEDEPPDLQDNPLPPAEEPLTERPLPQTDEPPLADESSIEEPPAEKPTIEGPFPKEDQPLSTEEPPQQENEPPDLQNNPLPPAEDPLIERPLPLTDEPPPVEEPSTEEPSQQKDQQPPAEELPLPQKNQRPLAEEASPPQESPAPPAEELPQQEEKPPPVEEPSTEEPPQQKDQQPPAEELPLPQKNQRPLAEETSPPQETPAPPAEGPPLQNNPVPPPEEPPPPQNNPAPPLEEPPPPQNNPAPSDEEPPFQENQVPLAKEPLFQDRQAPPDSQNNPAPSYEEPPPPQNNQPPPAEGPPPQEDSPKEEPPKSKKGIILWFSIIVVAIGVGVFLWWLIWGRFSVSTDDAYVHGNKVRLTPQIKGIVTAIHADNTQLVKEGQILVELDRTDRLMDFLQSRAELGDTVRKVTQMFEQVYVLASQVEVAESSLIKAEVDYIDRKHVVDMGAVSDEDFIHAEVAFVAAKATLKKVKYELLRALSEVQNTKVSSHPLVEKAKENLRFMWVNLQRCVLKAPATGIVAQRNVQVGESVSPDMPLLAIVPFNQMWINANFKEIHLSKIRIGQPVEMKADTYGCEVIYRGEVVGIEGGSGAVFSALPPQNATGNWIKIVQRVPVRISLHEDQLVRYPLRLGLTMKVTIDIRDTEGRRVPEPYSGKTLYKTDIFQEQILGSEQVIEEVLQENLTCDLDISEDVEELCHRLKGA